MGTIHLTSCVSETPVALLPRDVCARKFTIELAVAEEENEAAAQSQIKTYRLSADTKEQANEWCTNINYAIANLKLWNSKTKPSKPATANATASATQRK
jgi:hypothetical protein